MAINAHVAELERRHNKLEREIADALAHSSTDDLTIAELKRQKLKLKDEIERLCCEHGGLDFDNDTSRRRGEGHVRG